MTQRKTLLAGLSDTKNLCVGPVHSLKDKLNLTVMGEFITHK